MLSPSASIYLATEPVDFRISFDRLAGIVREHLAGDPRSRSFFIFVNRARDRCKAMRPGTLSRIRCGPGRWPTAATSSLGAGP